MRRRSMTTRLPNVRRSAAVLLGAWLMGMLTGCSSGESAQRANRARLSEATTPLGAAFEQLWNQRTILLGQMAGGGSFLGAPGGSRDSESPFPITVRATLMDSALVQAGIREFARLASMTEDELERFRVTYRTDHSLDQYIFVEAELQTVLAEDYLKLDRWVIFLEDERRNQYEPRRIETDPIQKPLARMVPGDVRDRESRFPASRFESFANQRIELYFPKLRIDGTPVITTETRSLKLVFVDARDSKVHAEGAWDFFPRVN